MQWPQSFVFNGKVLPYNRIPYNNFSERTLEVTLGFNFLIERLKYGNILEVGNTLAYYESIASENLGLNQRRIVDKFEQEVGVDRVDLMALPSSQKFNSILSISTVEHVGQGLAPSAMYGETEGEHDREAPLKAIAKIYDLLALGGQALITVPYGKLMDFGWFIQFSAAYLDLLFNNYQIPREAAQITTYGKVFMDMNNPLPKQHWRQEAPQQLAVVEYDFPWPNANAIAVILLNKLDTTFSLELDIPACELVYAIPNRDKSQTLRELSDPSFLELLNQFSQLNFIYTGDTSSAIAVESELTTICSQLQSLIPDYAVTLLLNRVPTVETIVARLSAQILATTETPLAANFTIAWYESLTEVQWRTLAPLLHGQIIFPEQKRLAWDLRLPFCPINQLIASAIAYDQWDGWQLKSSAQQLPTVDELWWAIAKKVTTPSFKVIVDGVFFQLYQTGIARVWSSVLQVWANTEFSHYVTVLDRANTAPRYEGLKYRIIHPYSYHNWEQDASDLQQICDEEGATIFISTYYTTPISTPSVFMAYDMIPEVLGGDLDEPMWRAKHQAIDHACAFVGISQNTLQDLKKYFPGQASLPQTLAHCGVDPLFRPATKAEVMQFRSQYGIQKPYFLLVAPGSGYKNSQLFFQAFAQLPTRAGFDIVCTGNRGTLEPQLRLLVPGTTIYTLQLSDEELRLAYAGAIALVYPSRYEGFGMPVLEALACGCPVITSPVSALPEVGGEAVFYVEPTDLRGMVEALCDIQKPSIRQSLSSAGLHQSQQFTWTQTAEQIKKGLITATLPLASLGTKNYLIAPDWSQPEEILGSEIAQIIYHYCMREEPVTLVFYTAHTEIEIIDLLLSGIAFELMMNESIDITVFVSVASVASLHSLQWSHFLPYLQGRIHLDCEDQDAIATFPEALPVIELNENP